MHTCHLVLGKERDFALFHNFKPVKAIINNQCSSLVDTMILKYKQIIDVMNQIKLMSPLVVQYLVCWMFMDANEATMRLATWLIGDRRKQDKGSDDRAVQYLSIHTP